MHDEIILAFPNASSGQLQAHKLLQTVDSSQQHFVQVKSL
jgi:hypothetical protein